MNEIVCDIDNKVKTPAECQRKHNEARKHQAFRAKTGRPPIMDPCAHCPDGIEAARGGGDHQADPERDKPAETKKEASEPMANKKPKYNNPYFQGTCPGCGKEGNILKRKKVCRSCAGKPAPETRQPTIAPGVQPGEFVDGQGKVIPIIPGQTVYDVSFINRKNLFSLDLNRVPGLRDALFRMADLELRSPEEQVLSILRGELWRWGFLQKSAMVGKDEPNQAGGEKKP